MSVLLALAAGLGAWLLVPPPVAASFPAAVGRRAPTLPVLGVALGLVLVMPHTWVAPGLVSALAGAGGLVLWHRRRSARESERNAALMAEVCDLLAAELAAGRPTEAALAEAAILWPELGPVAEVSRLGGDVPEALRRASLLPGAGGLRLLAAAWAVSRRAGGGLAAATRRVADAVRRDQVTRRLVAGELASARATARLVAGLPVVALLMGSGAGADPWSFLLRTSAGLACLACGLAVGFAGLWWIELIAREVDR